jgi:hypothetical protein
MAIDETFWEIIGFQKLLVQAVGPEFELVHKFYGKQLPYRWEIRTSKKPVECLDTIELRADDLEYMKGRSEADKLRYLQGKLQGLLVEC